MTVRIVTDSSCDLRGDEVADLNIEVVPLSIRFGDDEYTDREQLSVDRFYELLASSDTLPETAAPSPGRFAESFQRHLDAGATAIVCINISAALSATMQSAITLCAWQGMPMDPWLSLEVCGAACSEGAGPPC